MSNASVQDLTVQLEIVSEDMSNVDPAEVGEVTREVVEDLRTNGYDVLPAYTGERGGGALFDVIQHVTHAIQANQETIKILFGLVTPVIQYLLKAHERRADKDKEGKQTKDPAAKITLTIDGAPIVIEAARLEDAAKLVELFKASHPEVAARANLKSKIKITGNVPPKPARRRRR